MPEPVLPVRFGKYTLLRLLAAGGMAEIFLAVVRGIAGFEKLVVIKRILPALAGDPAFVEMLLHEARIAATLTHPNVVQVLEVDRVDGQYFIAMEHVHGEDLRAIIRQMKRKAIRELAIEHALGVILGTCAALVYVHERRGIDGTPLGIVHRDVSPQNVVVTFSGDVKLVDFGIAQSHREGPPDERGKLKGKVAYMSPEQARGERLDARSDLFALGTMLFELTTGKRLFKGQSEIETLTLICERDYPRPSEVRADYPPALESVVMRALAKDRVARYPSARALQADLESFVREAGLVTSSLALESFVRSLFEEKLLSEEKAIAAAHATPLKEGFLRSLSKRITR